MSFKALAQALQLLHKIIMTALDMQKEKREQEKRKIGTRRIKWRKKKDK